MPTYTGETAPYRAANGHTMVAPLVKGKHAAPSDEGRPVHAWAYCVDSCRACSEGDRPEYYAGEVD